MNVDEPERLGGTDTGLNPLEYLLATLAGCPNGLGHAVAREISFILNSWAEAIEARCPVSDNLINPTPIRINFRSSVMEIRDNGEENP